MACFIAPATEALIVSAVKHTHEKQEKIHSNQSPEVSTQTPVCSDSTCQAGKLSFSAYLMTKLHVLSALLWGGSFLLLIEHIWHGEIVPWFPFFTAVQTPEGTLQMFSEIATVGTTMAVVVTLAWLVGSGVCYQREKKADLQSAAVREG